MTLLVPMTSIDRSRLRQRRHRAFCAGALSGGERGKAGSRQDAVEVVRAQSRVPTAPDARTAAQRGQSHFRGEARRGRQLLMRPCGLPQLCPGLSPQQSSSAVHCCLAAQHLDSHRRPFQQAAFAGLLRVSRSPLRKASASVPTTSRMAIAECVHAEPALLFARTRQLSSAGRARGVFGLMVSNTSDPAPQLPADPQQLFVSWRDCGFRHRSGVPYRIWRPGCDNRCQLVGVRWAMVYNGLDHNAMPRDDLQNAATVGRVREASTADRLCRARSSSRSIWPC